MAYEDRFRSQDAMEKFLAAYDATMALWPIPYETMQIETTYGMTHTHVVGSPELPPLVLIHGGQISSTVWYPNVEALSQHFRVYMPDVVDAAGRSVKTRKLQNRQDCADWMTEVLDKLNIERATLIGHSHGGWMILNYAILMPERVERLVLLSPAGISRLRAEMFLRMLPAFIIPTRGVFYRSLQWITTKQLNVHHPEPVIDQFRQGAMSYKADELSFGVVFVFKDDELRQINVPALLLIGEQEKVINRKVVLERARRLIPDIESEIIPGAAHFLPIDQPDVVNARILAFLRR